MGTLNAGDPVLQASTVREVRAVQESAGLAVRPRRHRPQPSTVHPDLLWVMSILAGSRPLVVRGGDDAPPEASQTRRFCTLPGVRRPRLLLPVETSHALRAALVANNGLRSRQRRAARAALDRLLHVSPVRRLLGDDVALHVPSGSGDATPPLWSALAELLGEPVLLATSVHRRAPHRKPLFQVLTADGRTRGYVKVGWDAVTDAAIDVEAAALERHDELRAAGVITPRVLHHGSWGQHRMLLTAPLPPALTRCTGRSSPPPTAALRAIAPPAVTVTGPLASSPYVEGLRARLVGQSDVPLVAPVLQSLDRLVERAGDVAVETGPWHGDWVPWNLAWSADGLLVWDWEFAEGTAPVGFDPLHFHFEVCATVHRHTAERAFGRAVARSAPALAELGLDERARRVVPLLYLAENLSRRLSIHRAGGRVDLGFLRGTGALLTRAASRT